MWSQFTCRPSHRVPLAHVARSTSSGTPEWSPNPVRPVVRSKRPAGQHHGNRRVDRRLIGADERSDRAAHRLGPVSGGDHLMGQRVPRIRCGLSKCGVPLSLRVHGLPGSAGRSPRTGTGPRPQTCRRFPRSPPSPRRQSRQAESAQSGESGLWLGGKDHTDIRTKEQYRSEPEPRHFTAKTKVILQRQPEHGNSKLDS
jgi:hypothetical protein